MKNKKNMHFCRNGSDVYQGTPENLLHLYGSPQQLDGQTKQRTEKLESGKPVILFTIVTIIKTFMAVHFSWPWKTMFFLKVYHTAPPPPPWPSGSPKLILSLCLL